MSLPSWPLRHRGQVPVSGSRAFGARRADGARNHAGIDLYAQQGWEVLATEDGTIVAVQPFNGPRAHAILVEHDSGVVALYGEVEPNSGSLGLKIGDRVKQGQPIATVGVNPGGSSMIHFELYHRGTRQNERWPAGQPMPPNLIDPTGYLLLASSRPSEDTEVEDETPKTSSAGLILLIAGLISYFYRKGGR